MTNHPDEKDNEETDEKDNEETNKNAQDNKRLTQKL